MGPQKSYQDLNTICSKSQNPSSCWKALEPGAKKDLHSLDKHTINLALPSVHQAYKDIEHLDTEASDRVIREGYELCHQNN